MKDEQDRTLATIHVPDDKIQVLLNKLEAYRDFNPEALRKRDNRKLVESISNIKLATLREMWTDDPALYPAANNIITWEVWLRREAEGETPAVAILTNAATDLGYEVISNALSFVDRIVILVRGTREQLAKGAEILGILARSSQSEDDGGFALPSHRNEQHEWGDELLQRVTCRRRVRR